MPRFADAWPGIKPHLKEWWLNHPAELFMLTDRNAELVKMALGLAGRREHTYPELGKLFSLNPDRVRAIVRNSPYRALQVAYGKLDEEAARFPADPSMPLDEIKGLSFTGPQRFAFHQHDIQTLGDLLAITEADLKSWGLSKTSIASIQSALAIYSHRIGLIGEAKLQLAP